MDYQTFKRELYVAVLCREEAVGKSVRLTEEELSIFWEVEGKACNLQWQLEELYADFLENSWQEVIAEIVDRLRVQQ